MRTVEKVVFGRTHEEVFDQEEKPGPQAVVVRKQKWGLI